MLSKTFLREKQPPLKQLPLHDEKWYAAHKIEVRSGTFVTQINIDRRLAVLSNGESIEFNKACLAWAVAPFARRSPVSASATLFIAHDSRHSRFAKGRRWKKR